MFIKYKKHKIKIVNYKIYSCILFIPVSNEAQWTCKHVHLATAAGVKYPQLATGYLTIHLLYTKAV